MTQVELSDHAKARVTGMVELRQIVNQLIQEQLDDYPDEDIKACLLYTSFLASTMARFILVSMKIRTATLSPKHQGSNQASPRTSEKDARKMCIRDRNKVCALVLSVALCAGMAAPAFAYGGEPVQEVEQPVPVSYTHLLPSEPSRSLRRLPLPESAAQGFRCGC